MPAENPEELARQFGGCDLYIGIDIGRKHDATVLCALALQDGVFINAMMQVQRNKTFAEQSGMIQKLLSLPRARKCCIDATGIGAGIAEEAELKFGRKVEQTVFSSKTKEELAYNLKRAIEGRAILLPNDALLIADLHSIKRGYTRTASARLEADRGKTDGNGDRFWALALALRAAKEADVQPIIPLSKFVAPRRDPRMPFRALPPPARRSRR
jgi:phage FluMu gp28-like protein